ncbi:MAG: ArsR/SmtB family transcription factor [Thermoplasmatota archaeon]
MKILETSKVLSDGNALKILAATQAKPCTAQELSNDLGTPLAGTYKKIKELEENGLLEPLDRMLTSYGKRVTRYRSKLKGFYVEFYNNELRVTLETDSPDGPIRLKWNPLLNS